MLGNCSLCYQQSDLRSSHIVPKFVGKWLKNTSITGFMRGAITPEKRVQDLFTLPLLCNTCEQRFSKLEVYFAKNIFHPFHKEKRRSFEYDERLGLFIASLSWRSLKIGYPDLEKDTLVTYVHQAEKDWREYLLGKRKHMKPYENHLIFLDYVTEQSKVPEKFEWYTLRATDCTLAGNDKRIFAYTKFPWMIFVTSIYPHTLKGWEETEVKQIGKISTSQKITDGEFGNFLVERAKLALSKPSSKVSNDINEKILNAIMKNPSRFLDSDDFDMIIVEQDRFRREKMKKMPKSVIALVEEVLLKIEDMSNGNIRNNRLSKLRTRKIADIISNLSSEEVLLLDSKILFAINESKTTASDIKIKLETKDAWITFMVNPYSTKDYQQSKIKLEVDRLKLQNVAKKPIVVFSMNTSDDGVSFESGFLL